MQETPMKKWHAPSSPPPFGPCWKKVDATSSSAVLVQQGLKNLDSPGDDPGLTGGAGAFRGWASGGRR